MKISLNPCKEIFISDLVKFSINEITKERSIREEALLWCDGYLIAYFAYDSSEFTIKNRAKGILYIEAIFYAECKEKISQTKWNGYTIEVVDFSTHPLFKEIVKAIPKMEAENLIRPVRLE